MPESKEADQINQRLKEVANRLYNEYTGRKVNQLAGYDPLINLLMGAFASEFRYIYKEINESNSRVLEHLSKLLMPESLQGALPAYSVLHATPESNQVATDKVVDSVLFLKSGEKISFSPTGAYELFYGDTKWLLAANSLYEFKDCLEKKEIARTAKSLAKDEIWIGIESEDSKNELKELTFFFDWGNSVLGQHSESLLSTSKWYFNKDLLTTKLGIESTEESNPTLPFEDGNLVRKIEGEAIQFFHNQFITIKSEAPLFSKEKATIPEELMQAFEPNQLEKLIKKPVHWIKVKLNLFPITGESKIAHLINPLNIQINCFPVLNRKLLEAQFNLGNDFNLFPLNPRDYGHFFQIEEVLNSNGDHTYNEKILSQLLIENKEGNKTGSKAYSIRYNGMNRFNERNLSGLINDLSYRIREEIFVFNALGRNIVSNNIKLIRKALNDIENKLRREQGNPLTPIPYIVFPAETGEYVVVNYWTTQGPLGNNIPIGTPLKLESASSWKEASIKLMTTTSGGRGPLNESELLEQYKAQLVVKDRIVTEEDIRIYCHATLGEAIQEMTIQRGFTISEAVNQSFTRIVEVLIKMKREPEADYRLFMEKKLSTDLNTKSSIVIPIIVKIN